MGLTTHDFQSELDRLFAAAELEGQPAVEVNAGDLHRQLGDYPGRDHRMPVCCGVMRTNLVEGVDEIVAAPPSGQGASLTIRYRLPRPLTFK